MPIPATEPDPRAVIREGDMTGFQVIVVTPCIVICALDGFDVLVVAFTAAAIAREFSLDPTGLGILFSAGLAGMGFGALLIGPLGDTLGRRSTVLLCLAILCTGMLLSSMARTVAELAAMRLIAGLGIGGVLANINIVVAEYSSNRWRSLAISLLSLGYPIGAALGGAFSVYLISAHGWRSVYVFGGLCALVLIPAAAAYMPESLDYLIARRPARGLSPPGPAMVPEAAVPGSAGTAAPAIVEAEVVAHAVRQRVRVEDLKARRPYARQDGAEPSEQRRQGRSPVVQCRKHGLPPGFGVAPQDRAGGGPLPNESSAV